MNNRTKSAAHVVFGLDKEGKPRAALIHPADLEAVMKAAVGLGFKIGRADTPQALQMAKQLPDAKVFATGKGLISLVRKDIHEWLSKGLTPIETKAGADEAEHRAAAEPSAPNNSSNAQGGTASKAADSKLKPDPRLWDQLTVGSLVIAPEAKTKDDGYWPAIVSAISKDGQKLTIRWRDFPKQPPLTVKRRSVALLLDHS